MSSQSQYAFAGWWTAWNHAYRTQCDFLAPRSCHTFAAPDQSEMPSLAVAAVVAHVPRIPSFELWKLRQEPSDHKVVGQAYEHPRQESRMPWTQAADGRPETKTRRQGLGRCCHPRQAMHVSITSGKGQRHSSSSARSNQTTESDKATTGVNRRHPSVSTRPSNMALSTWSRPGTGESGPSCWSGRISNGWSRARRLQERASCRPENT